MKKLLFSIFSSILIILALEIAVRVYGSSVSIQKISSLDKYINTLFSTPLSERENENRFIIHNAYLFSNSPWRATISSAFIGTSRTKVIRPSMHDNFTAVISADNSYNEISYGLLIEAKLLKHIFPNLQKIYVESSLLLRRPPAPRFTVEQDHLKYLPVLKTFIPIRSAFLDGQSFIDFVTSESSNDGFKTNKSLLFENRSQYKLTSLFKKYFSDPSTSEATVEKSSVLKGLDFRGEETDALPVSATNEMLSNNLAMDSPIVRRIWDVNSYAPYDYLFEMIALWGEKNGIHIVFYQPPVRPDFHEVQVSRGLQQHSEDLINIARQYDIPFIDLNTHEYLQLLSKHYFSDADHLRTCIGSSLFYKSIMLGESKYSDSDTESLNIKKEEFSAILFESEAICRQLNSGANV